MKAKNPKLAADIRGSEIVCWLAIRYEDLADIKKNSVLAVKVSCAAGDHQSELRERYVAAAQDFTDASYLEVDDNASVELSKNDDGGAYVQCWIWVDSSALEKQHPGPNHARRQQFVTDTLLPTVVKKGSNGKKEGSKKATGKKARKKADKKSKSASRKRHS